MPFAQSIFVPSAHTATPLQLPAIVFTEELLRTYVEYKRSKEVDAIRLRPHPYEFALYYDI